MKKIILVLTFFCVNIIYGQILLKPDSIHAKEFGIDYAEWVRKNDSISNIKLTPDTTSNYLIVDIDTFDNYYVIYADGKANGEDYMYKIKSLQKESINVKGEYIEIGKRYQLDLRLYGDENMRIHFCECFFGKFVAGFGHFDMIENINSKRYNMAMNLNGLFLFE